MHLHILLVIKSIKNIYIYIYIQEEIHICVNVMPKCNHNLQRKIQRKEYKENENTFIQFL